MKRGLPSASGTQRERILRLLIEARGAWIPLPEILALGIAQYGARIHELRKRGLNIENRHETTGGVCHSWFRLVDSQSPPVPTVSKPSPKWGERQPVTGLPLFDSAVRS